MSFEAFVLRGESDRTEVLRLWRDNLSDQRIKAAIGDRWRWLAESNPAGPPKICVVTDVATGAVIGSAGALPRVLRIGGKEVTAGLLCDFVVDKKHRVAGPAVALQRRLAQACFADGFDLIYGFPNDAAFPVFARVGYKTVGTATMLFRPIRSAHKLRHYVPTALAGAAGFFADRLLQAYDLQLYLRRKRNLDDAVCNQASGEFQALWDQAKAEHPIAGERTPAHLNWRYANHPIDRCTFFCLTKKSGSGLHAYIAYDAVGGRVNILDAFWDSPAALMPLFVRFVHRMRLLGHSSISVCHAGDGAVLQPLRQLAFVRSKRRRRFICKVAPQRAEAIGATAYDPSRWSLFDGELDI
jgi:GNAT superfamily N-acetyltransferase